MSVEETDERILAWREERKKVAAQEKAKRLELRKAEAQDQDRLAAEKAKILLEDIDAFDELATGLSDRHRERRRNTFGRFALCVLAPLALAALWCFVLATPLYQSQTSFVVLSPQADTAVQSSSLFVAQDLTDRNHGAFLAQTFVTSDDLLDEIGVAQFARSKWSAAISRTANAVFATDFADNYLDVQMQYQSGLTTVSVYAPDPDRAQQLTTEITDRTAEKIDTLYSKRTATRVADAENRLFEAERDLRKAVGHVHDTRLTYGDIDPEAHLSAVYAQIDTLAAEKAALVTKLKTLELVDGGGTAQAERYRSLIADFEQRIDDLRNPGGATAIQELSIASVAIQQANFDVSLAEQRLSLARERFEDALKSATLSQSLVQVVVTPSLSTGPSFPDPINTFGIALFLGIVAYAFVQIARR